MAGGSERPMAKRPLSDPIAAEVAALIHQPWHLRTDAPAARGWIAVQVEKGRHVEPDAAPGLALAIRAQGAATC